MSGGSRSIDNIQTFYMHVYLYYIYTCFWYEIFLGSFVFAAAVRMDMQTDSYVLVFQCSSKPELYTNNTSRIVHSNTNTKIVTYLITNK
jgi:hypothetical protein